MMERAVVIEIEKRAGGEYRVELRDRESGLSIDSTIVDGTDTAETRYKHACKLRLPAESEPTIGLESGRGDDRIVLRTDGRTHYRHALPSPEPAVN